MFAGEIKFEETYIVPSNRGRVAEKAFHRGMVFRPYSDEPIYSGNLGRFSWLIYQQSNRQEGHAFAYGPILDRRVSQSEQRPAELSKGLQRVWVSEAPVWVRGGQNV